MFRLTVFILSILHAQSGHSGIIGGQGAFKYEYDPDKLLIPAGASIMHAHGWAVDESGNIILTYAPDPQSSDKYCLVRWSRDGTNGTLFGPGPELSKGTPHGLRLVKEGSENFLYHANNGAALYKTRLNGTVVWDKHGPPTDDKRFVPFHPTWFAIPPESKFAYLADGYGSNYIHVYTKDGQYTGKSFGGPGIDAGKFQTCHSINYDPRLKKLVVSDRENHRHQYFDFDRTSPDIFKYNSSFSIPELSRPCNIRFEFGSGYAIVPALEGPVGILDQENKLVSLIDVAKLLGKEGHLHPHDATFLPNGDFVVGTWNPGRVSYWRRLPQDKMLHV